MSCDALLQRRVVAESPKLLLTELELSGQPVECVHTAGGIAEGRAQYAPP